MGLHHVGCLLGYLGARDSHGDADVGHLQCRGVVHAVTSHSHDLAVREPLGPLLQDRHDVLLELRLRPREDEAARGAEQHRLLLRERELGELVTDEGLVRDVLVLVKHADGAADGLRSRLVVASDDDDPNASLLACVATNCRTSDN